jgi:hypothetical protein
MSTVASLQHYLYTSIKQNAYTMPMCCCTVLNQYNSMCFFTVLVLVPGTLRVLREQVTVQCGTTGTTVRGKPTDTVRLQDNTGTRTPRIFVV